MNTPAAWHETDEFWLRFAPIVFSGAAAGFRTATEVELVTKYVTSGARILDLCCGCGRHCLELAKQGFMVTGVDRTALYLYLASHQAEQMNLQINWVLGDMRSFERQGYFACITCFGTSFGWFQDQQSDRRVT